MKRFIFIMTTIFMLIGCGGGTSSGNGGNNGGENDGGNGNGGSGGKYIDPNDINVSTAIQQGKISGYSESNTIEDNYLAVINYIRSLKIDCGDEHNTKGPADPLSWNDKLYQAAFKHSKDVVNNFSLYFDNNLNSTGKNPHEGSGTSDDIPAANRHSSNGSTFDERIKYENYQYPLSENVAVVLDPNSGNNKELWKTAIDGLIRSPHHCRNIMDKNAKDFGMAEYVSPNKVNGMYRYFWTQNFGSSEN